MKFFGFDFIHFYTFGKYYPSDSIFSVWFSRITMIAGISKKQCYNLKNMIKCLLDNLEAIREQVVHAFTKNYSCLFLKEIIKFL